MKKIVCISLLLMLVMTAMAAESDYTYINMKGSGIRITGYRGRSSRVEIPRELDGKPVTSIGEYAFEGKRITEVSLPDGITDIGMAAFRNCSSLVSVTFATDGDLTVGNYAFYGCDALKNVSFTGKIHDLTLNAHTFENCYSLSDFSIPDSLTSIHVSDTAFDGADALNAESWNVKPVSRDMTVLADASTDNYNHTGYVWSQEYYINGEQVDVYSRITLKPGDIVTVEAVITEEDTYPDTGAASAFHVVTAEDILKGFTVGFFVDVEENAGRYAGCVCRWKVAFRFY